MAYFLLKLTFNHFLMQLEWNLCEQTRAVKTDLGSYSSKQIEHVVSDSLSFIVLYENLDKESISSLFKRVLIFLSSSRKRTYYRGNITGYFIKMKSSWV
jgi:hypothetical protein